MKSPQHKNKTPKSRSDPQQQQKSNSLAVTVFRNAPDYYSCDPLIPLSTCLPASGTCAARMRLLPHADQGLSLRRSPRFNSAPAAVDGGNAGSRKRKRSPETAATAAEEETSRRRSPRFSTPVKVCHCPFTLRAVLFFFFSFLLVKSGLGYSINIGFFNGKLTLVLGYYFFI